MAFEVEVPVRHRTMWLAFTDPEKMALAVPGLTVDAVQPVDAANGPEGVSADVVAGRLKLKVGSGATITYRGTACIAEADAQNGTLDVAVDVAQARGNGALAGYLRISLTPSGPGGDKTLISVVPELELSGRALDFKPDELHEAASTLATAWLQALAEQYVGSETPTVEPTAAEPAQEPESVSTAETIDAEVAEESVVHKADSAPVAVFDDSLSGDPLETVWRGEYEKNPWIPVIMALAFLLLIRRSRRQRRSGSKGAH